MLLTSWLRMGVLSGLSLSMSNGIVCFVLWFVKYFVPPMVANASPLLVSGSHPIDRGRLFIDGRPLLGPGKTVEGFVTGVLMALFSSMLVSVFVGDEYFVPYGFIGGVVGLLGDMVASFFKRRLGLRRGDPLPIVDQLDFAFSASLFYWLVDPGFVSRPVFIVYGFVIILALHIVTNNIAYYMGVKDRRW